MKQLTFLELKNNEYKSSKIYGGSLSNGKRKSKRPLDSRKPLHIVLKAKDSYLLLRNKKLVESILSKMAKKFGIKVYSLAVQGRISAQMLQPRRAQSEADTP